MSIIVIEGLDGAGKTTQTGKTIDWITGDLGRKVVTFDFPAYDKTPFGKIIGGYLKGDYCDPVAHDPFESTLLYAGDRLHQAPAIKQAVSDNNIVVINRYVPSNIAYSIAKLHLQSRSDEIEKMIRFNESLEYDLLGIPRPDHIIFLDVEPSSADEMIRSRSSEVRAYLDGQQRDRYESNRDLQRHVRDSYLYLAGCDYNLWTVIKSNDASGMRSVDDIQSDIRFSLRGVR